MSITATTAQTSLSERVAEEIRVAMLRRRITGARLATELGVSPAWISYRLSGKQAIDLNDLDRIASAIGVPIIDLLPPSTREVSPAALLPSRGSTTAQYVAQPQARPHAVDVRSPRSGMSGSVGSRSRRSRRLVDQMAA